MTPIRGRGRLRRERISEGPLGSSPSPKSSHDETSANPFAGLLVAKYMEEDLQRILRTVLKVRAPPSDGPREKPLKARSPDVYRGKSHIECYNFCQQCEDHFATAEAKDPNRILFATLFFHNRINFQWQQYKRKQNSFIPISWDEFKAFLWRSLGDSRAFVDSYWAKIKRDSQYQQKYVLDWAAHLEHFQAVLREFDSVTAPNNDSLIRYFREGLRPSIRA